jgi:hypothetical protein
MDLHRKGEWDWFTGTMIILIKIHKIRILRIITLIIMMNILTSREIIMAIIMRLLLFWMKIYFYSMNLKDFNNNKI